MNMVGFYFSEHSDIVQITQVLKKGLINICPELDESHFVKSDSIHLTLSMVGSKNIVEENQEVFSDINKILKKHSKKFPMKLTLDRLKRVGPKTVLAIKRNTNFKALFKIFCEIEDKILNKWSSKYISNFINGQFYITLTSGMKPVCVIDEEILKIVNENCFLSSISFELENIFLYNMK